MNLDHPDSFFYPEPFPISSAPKDGTEILALDDGYWSVIRWNNNTHEWLDQSRSGGEGYNPTCWFPLPSTELKS